MLFVNVLIELENIRLDGFRALYSQVIFKLLRSNNMPSFSHIIETHHDLAQHIAIALHPTFKQTIQTKMTHFRHISSSSIQCTVTVSRPASSILTISCNPEIAMLSRMVPDSRFLEIVPLSVLLQPN